MRAFPDVRRIPRCAQCPDAATVEVELTGSRIPDAVLDLCAFHAELLQRRAVPLVAAMRRGPRPRSA